MSLRGSLRSSESELALAHLHLTARRERQSFIDGKRGEGRVLIPENGHEKGGRLPNQETDVRRLFCVFGVASLLGKLACARQFIFYREARTAEFFGII